MTNDDKARRVRGILYALLVCAATARLLLQTGAMPPYAGLDEIYHVARLAFSLQEHRHPTTRERSIPPYLERSIQQKHDALPAFGVIGSRWPEVIKTNPVVVRERPLTPADLRPYQRPNYEAQQASPYYTIAAPLGAVIVPRTTVSEQRMWRLFSVMLGVMIIIASAIAAERWFGPAGIVAAALIASFPTWLTLVARAGNDALACALVAGGIAMTASTPPPRQRSTRRSRAVGCRGRDETLHMAGAGRAGSDVDPAARAACACGNCDRGMCDSRNRHAPRLTIAHSKPPRNRRF